MKTHSWTLKAFFWTLEAVTWALELNLVAVFYRFCSWFFVFSKFFDFDHFLSHVWDPSLRSFCAHFAFAWVGKWTKRNMFTTLASKFDFKVFLNYSNPTHSVHAASTIAQSTHFYRPCRKWKTAFRLRLCEQIKGGTVQRTNRKTKKLYLRTSTLRRMFLVEET